MRSSITSGAGAAAGCATATLTPPVKLASEPELAAGPGLKRFRISVLCELAGAAPATGTIATSTGVAVAAAVDLHTGR
jgi:hypothetical protein